MRRPRTHALAFILCLFSAALAVRTAAAADPATRPAARPPTAGTLTGKVTSPGDVPLSEMVIYLESPDAARRVATPGETVKVSQKGAKFSPAIVIVCVGQTVDFLNDEERPIEHNVFSNAPAKRFDLGLYRPGEARSVAFDKAGAVYLYCSIHRHMDGVVYVAPTPFTSRVAEDGSYTIDGVPPGAWIVKTWQRQRRFPELSVPVQVEAGKSATADLELLRK